MKIITDQNINDLTDFIKVKYMHYRLDIRSMDKLEWLILIIGSLFLAALIIAPFLMEN